MSPFFRSVRARFAQTVREQLAARDRALITGMRQIGRPRAIDVYKSVETNDYVRLSALELCAYEIASRGVGGNTAEVGVYRGTFAAKINALFPSSLLYLFDTFTGFDADQLKAERSLHGLNHDRDFSDTSISMVLAQMIYPEKCHVRKGFFPATAQGVDDEFCFVSLDTDLHQPTYDGLTFFWPRMRPGGFIFVHDYNNSAFPGVQSAVRRFSGETGAPFSPLPDTYGTAIFSK